MLCHFDETNLYMYQERTPQSFEGTGMMTNAHAQINRLTTDLKTPVHTANVNPRCVHVHSLYYSGTEIVEIMQPRSEPRHGAINYSLCKHKLNICL